MKVACHRCKGATRHSRGENHRCMQDYGPCGVQVSDPPTSWRPRGSSFLDRSVTLADGTESDQHSLSYWLSFAAVPGPGAFPSARLAASLFAGRTAVEVWP